MRYPGFIGGAYKSRNPRASNEVCINLYLEPIEAEAAPNRWQLVPAPGVGTYSTSATNIAPGRALDVFNGRAFAVIGSEFIELTTGGTRTLRGTVVIGADLASLSYNGSGGHQIVITSGTRAYCYDTISHAFAEIVLPGLANVAVMLAGYTIVLDRVASTIYQSSILDSLTFDALDSATRIIAGNPWRQAAVLGNELFLLGEMTSEVWYVADTYPFALAPHPSGEIPMGIAANWSVAKVGASLLWLAQSESQRAIVVQASGFQPQVVSDFAIQAAIGSYSRIDDAIGWGFDDDAGHSFYALEFPSASTTWVYDLSTGRWHERRLWVSESAQWQGWRPRYHADFEGQSLTLDRSGANVLVLTTGLGTDQTRPIRRIRRAPYLVNELNRLFISRFGLLMRTGQGLQTGQGSNPMLTLNVSIDGGETWWNAGDVSSGKVGEYEYAPEWTRLGSGDSFVFEIDMTDPVPWYFVDAFVEAK